MKRKHRIVVEVTMRDAVSEERATQLFRMMMDHCIDDYLDQLYDFKLRKCKQFNRVARQYDNIK